MPSLPFDCDLVLHVRLVDDVLEFVAREGRKRVGPSIRFDRRAFHAFIAGRGDPDLWLVFVAEPTNSLRYEHRNHIRIVVGGISRGRREFAEFWELMYQVLGGDPNKKFSIESVYGPSNEE